MRAKTNRAALLAAAPASVRARNGQPSGAAGPLPPPPVAPPAPAERQGRGSARPVTPVALPGALDAIAGVVVELPGLRLASDANARGDARKTKGWRNKRIRATTAAAFRGVPLPPLPLRVCVTRIAPLFLDSDNIHGSGAKAVRDEVADVLGLRSDRDPRVTWRVAQEKGAVGVRVTLAAIDGRADVVAGECADVVAMRLTPGEASALCTALARGSAVVTVGGVELRLTTDGGRR